MKPGSGNRKKILGKYWAQYACLADNFLENLEGLTTLQIYEADGFKASQMAQEAENFRRVTMKVLTMQLNSIIIMDVIAYGGAALGICAALTRSFPFIKFLILAGILRGLSQTILLDRGEKRLLMIKNKSEELSQVQKKMAVNEGRTSALIEVTVFSCDILMLFTALFLYQKDLID